MKIVEVMIVSLRKGNAGRAQGRAGKKSASAEAGRDHGALNAPSARRRQGARQRWNL